MQYLLVLLTLVFVVCKIVGLIAWSWWLVFLPAIILFLFYAIVFVMALIVAIKDE